MNALEFLVFEVDEFKCALPLKNVVRVESAVAPSPLPNAPDVVAGVVNVRGKLFPVMDVRTRLQKESKAMALSDHLILAKTERRDLALWVGAVSGVEQHRAAPQEDFKSILELLPHLSGVSLIGDQLILIHDLENFLSDDEETQLTQAMDAATS